MGVTVILIFRGTLSKLLLCGYPNRPQYKTYILIFTKKKEETQKI